MSDISRHYSRELPEFTAGIRFEDLDAATVDKLHASGQAVIAAIVAGFEAACRIGEAINPSSYWFWHTNGVVGSFSSAVIAEHLLGLDGARMNHAGPDA